MRNNNSFRILGLFLIVFLLTFSKSDYTEFALDEENKKEVRIVEYLSAISLSDIIDSVDSIDGLKSINNTNSKFEFNKLNVHIEILVPPPEFV